jgi:hypothetical protein
MALVIKRFKQVFKGQKNNDNKPSGKRACFKCGKIGHFIANCPCNDNKWKKVEKGKSARRSNENITHIQIMHGLTTRTRARQLNLQVRSYLVNCILKLTLCVMDGLMIRNLGEDHQGLGKGQDIKEEKLERSQQEKAKSDSTSSLPLSPRPVSLKWAPRMHLTSD